MGHIEGQGGAVVQTLVIETQINAPPETCFDLIRERGKVTLGETVTFEETHFTIRQRLTVKVTECQRPHRFTDEMIEGNFKSFKHIHEFVPDCEGTLLRDTLIWTSPFGIVGRLVDALLLKDHLKKVVTLRNGRVRHAAESAIGRSPMADR